MESDRGAYKQDEALAFDLLDAIRSLAQQRGLGTEEVVKRALELAVAELGGRPRPSYV